MPAVFVVEPSSETGDALSRRIRGEGYHVLSVASVDEAGAVLRCIRADMLVVDCRRNHGGPALIRQLRESECDGVEILLVNEAGTAVLPAEGLRPTSRVHVVAGDGDPTDIKLLERIRGHLAPLSEPFN